jgi:hypothetical protein
MPRRCWFPALVCTLLGLSWQLSTVHFNYADHATALFCTGSANPPPPGLAFERIYLFPHSNGYDGQAYHYMAHDPLYRNGIGRAVDAPTVRYRRILIPALAWLLALGRPDWIDFAYFACNLAFLFLGAWWLACLMARTGIGIWFSLLYLAVPSTLISLDRMTVDLALTSLAVGFAVYAGSNSRGKLYLVLALAALCRDTGAFLAVACVVPLLFHRRFREAAVCSSALIPAAIWNVFVSWHIPSNLAVPNGKLVPFLGWLGPWLHPAAYNLSAALATAVRALDWLQLAGLLLAFLLGLSAWREARNSPIQAACLLWSAMGILLPPFWQEDAYFSRLFSPLLVLLAAESLRERTLLPRLPLAMVAPRICVQLTPQALGVLRGLLGG